MKFLSKLLISAALASCGAVQGFSDKVGASAYYVLNGIHLLNSNALLLNQLFHMHGLQREAPQLVDVPDAVGAFCRTKLTEHGLDASRITIKVKKDFHLIAVISADCIIFSDVAAAELNKVLLDHDKSELSASIVKMYDVLIDHEIAHIKNNDVFKRNSLLVALSAGTHVLGSYVMNSEKWIHFFKQPTTGIELCKAWLAYGLLGQCKALCTKVLYSWYCQSQENAADQYAFNCSHDPEALRLIATFFEQIDEEIISFFEGRVELSSVLPWIVRYYLNILRSALVAEYTNKKPQENFRSWIKQHTVMLTLVKNLYDPVHPAGVIRAQHARDAADKLEQKPV